MISHRRGLNLDLMPDEESQRVKDQNALVKKNLSLRSSSRLRVKVNAPLGPEYFHPCDSVEHLRHDLGNLPISVVDDAGAEELDDGLSIEPVPNEPGSAWIHIHIADPTSVPSTDSSSCASSTANGLLSILCPQDMAYVNSLSYPRTAQLSLAFSGGKPEPVFAFSFKVDGEHGRLRC